MKLIVRNSKYYYFFFCIVLYCLLLFFYSYADSLETNLGRELENSRITKLLSKLGFINERPEFEQDPRWSETGDRYMIKLFRDYMFHQVNEMGVPVTDMSHIITCLNKVKK